MADSRVLPISSVSYGLKAETSFGVGLDSSGDDGTAYLTQPVVQAQPTRSTNLPTRETFPTSEPMEGEDE